MSGKPPLMSDGVVSGATVQAIRGSEILINYFGSWPEFHDFEVITITLERAPWLTAATSDLRAVFYGFDVSKSPEDPERKQSLIEMLFQGVDQLRIDGFNHQNPIIGISIQTLPDQSNFGRWSVNWGGTGIHHEVSFLCQEISVIRITPLNPFNISIPNS